MKFTTCVVSITYWKSRSLEKSLLISDGLYINMKKCIDLHYYVVVNITTIHFHYKVVKVVTFTSTVVTFTIQFLQCSLYLFNIDA